MQSKRMSFTEACVSAAIGYIVANCLYMVVLPMFGHETTWEQSFWITLVFAIASTIRAFVVRRVFNWLG